MPCRKTTQTEVLERVRARLLAAIKQLQDPTCYLSLDPEPDEQVKGDLFVSLAPMGGVFDQEWLTGAGQEGCREQSGVIVSVWSRVMLDKFQSAKAALTDADRGLLPWKHRILASLTDHDLLDASGNPILTDRMQPVTSDHPKQAMYRQGMTGFSLAFSTNFIWDLSTAGIST